MAGIDAVLTVDPTTGLYDFSIDSNGDIESADFFDTAILYSLFGERRASADEVVEPQRRRGWIGNGPDFENGSKLWLLRQARLTRSTLNSLQDEAEKALQWLVDDGHAVSISDIVASVSNGSVVLGVTISRSRDKVDRRLYQLWELTGRASIVRRKSTEILPEPIYTVGSKSYEFTTAPPGEDWSLISGALDWVYGVDYEMIGKIKIDASQDFTIDIACRSLNTSGTKLANMFYDFVDEISGNIFRLGWQTGTSGFTTTFFVTGLTTTTTASFDGLWTVQKTGDDLYLLCKSSAIDIRGEDTISINAILPWLNNAILVPRVYDAEVEPFAYTGFRTTYLNLTGRIIVPYPPP